MHNRYLPIALLIAAAALPVSGCGDSQSASAAQSAGTDAASADNAPPLPLDQAQPPQPSLADQIKSLRQALRKQQRQADQRFAQQAKRIDQLEQTVDRLRTRLRRLPPPSAFKKLTAQSDATSKTAHPAPADAQGSAPPSDNRHPTSSTSADPGKSSDKSQTAAATPAAADAHGGDPADVVRKVDAQSSDPSAGEVPGQSTQAETGGAIPKQQPPAHCPPHTATDQFDVFFQQSQSTGLDQARAAVKKAALHDWFVTSSRLYVGRYGTCPLAEHRQKTVHAKTGLPLRIAAVKPRRARHSHRHAADHTHHAPAGHAPSQAKTPPVLSTPFEIVGVEQRGAHQYLGVAPEGAIHSGQITWLSPRQHFAGWQLTGIHEDRGTVIFAAGGQAVSVALPADR
ncbi:MAG: hypothetical protein PF501_16965 [Salinisphaera sp.]|nr:hypothetical protein [Salinisphaera sp.]